MDDNSFNIRVPKKWARVGMTVLVTALIVAPLTAIAAHQFDDVPNSNTFHADIGWLADAGVTKGCNPPTNDEFCPDDPTTRGQMAAFMRRFAQYLGAEDGTPAQADNATTANSATTAADADKLDGKAASVYTNPIWGAAIDWSTDGQGSITGSVSSGNEILTLAVQPPANGVLSLTYNLGVFDSAAFYGAAWLQYDNSTCDWDDRVLGSSSYYDDEGTAADAFTYVTGAAVKGTTAGAHNVTLCAGLFDGSTVTRNDANIVAAFSSTGTATVTDQVAPDGASADPTQ